MSFEKLYKQLNLEQKKAVDFIEGPVMVVAGPGTGKTRILTIRIANILRKTDTNPENILALTFTDSGAFSMRSSLIDIIGSDGYLVNISTFHSFCNSIINNYLEYFPKIIGFKNINELQQIKIIKSLIEKNNLHILKPYGDPFYYLKNIISSIDKIKREGIDEEEFEKIIKKEEKEFKNNDDIYYEKGPYKGKMKGFYQKIWKRIEKNKELALIYKKYQERINQLKLYDYSDMIIEVLKELSSNKDLLLSLQEKYQYILVDEHQDTNNAQNKILEKLLSFHENPNIFIVGDEKQAIYRFQGASLSNFNYFKKVYPNIKIIKLKDNYRSTKDILDVAENIIPSGLLSKIKYKNRKIKISSFLDEEKEIYFTVKDIKEKIKKGIKPSNIAVIYRDNKDSLDLISLLEKEGISFFIDSEENLISDTDIKKIIILLKTIKNFGEEEYLVQSMHIDFVNIDPLDIFNIVESSRTRKENIYNFIKSNKFNSLKLYSKDNIVSFLEKLFYLKKISKNENLTFLLEKIINDFKYIGYLFKKEKPIDKIEKLKIFLKEAKKYNEEGLEAFIEYLDLLKENNLSIKNSYKNYSSKNIRLLTAHKSKGLEFEYVYIIKAYSGHWGDRKNLDVLPLSPLIFSLPEEKINKEERNEEERKLFYVAITRAKKEVNISYPKKNKEGRDKVHSKFIEEIKEGLIIKEENNLEEEISISPSSEIEKWIKDKELIKNLFIKRGLSITGLNNYLECPLKYFYKDLIKIPESLNNDQIYGTAIHETLKDFFNSLKERLTDKSFLKVKFSNYLNKHYLTKEDYKKLKDKGEKDLTNYYNYYKNSWIINTIPEFNINGIILSPEIHLSGKIDKIEFLNEREVNVVDYKTSKPKSRNEIEGKTKNSNGNIKRQLIFYNILLNSYKNGKYKMVSGEIDFISPNDKGFYKKEKFVITEQEIKELEELIKKTSKEITSLSFLNKGCNKKDCLFCELKKISSL